MSECVLISVVGTTDPIRDSYDGPNLHIIRHMNPQKVYLLLTKEMEKTESENKKAINMLNPKCKVIFRKNGIENVHDFDGSTDILRRQCEEIKKENPNAKVIINISSGTPQIKVILCMLALSDRKTYKAIQVVSPNEASNTKEIIRRKDVVQEFENDIDNLDEAKNRCVEPDLEIFKKPIIQFQIQSLIEKYEYGGARELYRQNEKYFDAEVGVLLEHAIKRINIDFVEAKKIVQQKPYEKELYPIAKSSLCMIADYYNNMCVKRKRMELNDFALRIEVIAEYIAIYMLENCMKVKLEDIAPSDRRGIHKLNKKKCEEKMTEDISLYMDNLYGKAFKWEEPISANNIIQIVKFLAQKKYNNYIDYTKKMQEWIKLIKELRHPAAHTIISITDEMFKKNGKTTLQLCREIENAIIVIGGTEVKEGAFDIYNIINRLIVEKIYATT